MANKQLLNALQKNTSTKIQMGTGFQVGIVATAPEPPQLGALRAPLQDIARHYVGARRRSGEALLEMARWLSEARAEAQHGEWQVFLEATSTSDDTAERLLNIHTKAMENPQFADAIARNWLTQSAAALLARPSTPQEVISEVLDAEQAPRKSDIERRIRAKQTPAENPHSADFESQSLTLHTDLVARVYRIAQGRNVNAVLSEALDLYEQAQ